AIAAALLERAVGAGAVLLETPVSGLELAPDGARVTLGERRLTAGLVVAAGADSPTRALAGLEVAGSAYPQEAVVAHLDPERAHGATARQRFLPGGPL